MTALITIAHVAGVFAAVVAAAFLAILAVGVVGAIAGCVLSSRASAAEERGRIIPDARPTIEPDPIETYPTRIRVADESGILDIKKSLLIPPPSPVVVWFHRERSLPVPLNPLGSSEHSLRIRE